MAHVQPDYVSTLTSNPVIPQTMYVRATNEFPHDITFACEYQLLRMGQVCDMLKFPVRMGVETVLGKPPSNLLCLNANIKMLMGYFKHLVVDPSLFQNEQGAAACHFIQLARCVVAHSDYHMMTLPWMRLYYSAFYIISGPNYLDLPEVQQRIVLLAQVVDIQLRTVLPKV